MSDPFQRTLDELGSLAPETLVQRGVGYFKDDRVLELSWEEGLLRASVEGAERDQPYELQIEEGEGGLAPSCDCLYDQGPFCEHSIAALLAYAAAQQEVEEEAVVDAREEALRVRSRRARTEVVVEHVAGDPEFGTWSARSLQATGVGGRRYRVLIRSLSEPLNYCSCHDFATGRLGTCKHIEAALDKARRKLGKRKSKRAEKAGPRVSVVHLDWRAAEPPAIRLRRAAEIPGDLAHLLDLYFDEAGYLAGHDDTSLLTLADGLLGREEVHLSAEVLEHVRRLLEDESHALRAQRIRDRIQRSGGHLPGLRARLYPYQVRGVAFLASAGRAVLADDMGLGKTLQAIAASVWLSEYEGVRRVLIVCPASLKHQWAREIERFTGHQAVVVQGNAKARKALYRQPARYVICNYELVLRDHHAIVEAGAPDLLVLDEAQRIKNWKTKTADAVKSVPSRYAFVLSGTPLENRLEDLYSVMQVIDRRVLGPLWQFLVHFHVTDPRGKVLGYRNLSELRRRLQGVMLRRDRRVVADQLPERIVQRLDTPMTRQQRELHDGAMSAARKIARIPSQQKRPLSPAEQKRLLAALQTARMACDHGGLVDETIVGSPKLSEITRLLDELSLQGGEKVVVFSQWRRMLDLVKVEAEELGLGVAYLHGGVPTRKRGALIDRFAEDPSCQVFLSTDAGATGLNLQAASVLINVDLPYNPALLDQRLARIHRLGQQRTVQIVLLVAADSYEHRVGAILEGKRELFLNVVDPDATEDVVGVSRKNLEVALEALEEDEPRAGAAEAQPALEAAAPEAEAPTEGSDGDAPTPGRARVLGDGGDVSEMVATLQGRLGDRLVRVLGLGGTLFAIVSRVDPSDGDLAAELAGTCPVAIVEPVSFRALQAALPETREAHAVYDRAEPSPPSLASRHRTLAARKLKAAEALLAAELPGEALDLTATAVAAALAARSAVDAVPSPDDLALWLFGELVPTGLATADEAGLYLRARSFAEAEGVPHTLAAEVLRDARALVEG